MTTTEVLLKAGYGSTEEVFQGWARMEAMSRMEQYRAECGGYTGPPQAV